MRYRILALAAAAALSFGTAHAQHVLPPETTINCAYNLSVPTLTNTWMGRVQCDASGRLILGTSTATIGTETNSAAILSAIQGSTPAGENHIGEVGGNLLTVASALVTSNNTVTTGKAVGPLQTIANAARVSGTAGSPGTGGLIQAVMLTFKDAIGSVPFDVYYFNANPSGSTCTDNAAFVLVDADRDKVIAVVHVSDITASNTVAIAQALSLAVPYALVSATSVYACVVTRGSAAITGTANASLITRFVRN
jgi:hypothetical protein